MKKIISICLTALLIMPAFSLNIKAETAAVKGGYTLVPTVYGKSGVDVSSSFLLTTPADMTQDVVKAAVSIDDQPLPTITQKSSREFLIKPMDLSSNSLYVFRFKQNGKADITWAFQTSYKFKIVSSLPSDQSTNVPVNSGIEITFSDTGYTPLDDYFKITPKAEGRFEYHKNTAVFVPKSLSYKTLYTVTVKAGIKLTETGEALTEDYVFAFETEAKPDHNAVNYAEYPNFDLKYVELPSVEPPRVGFRIRHEYNKSTPNANVNVYMFNDSKAAAEAAQKLMSTPSWSNYASKENYIDTTNLKKTASFNTKDTYDVQNSLLTLPDSLPQGFYLVQAELKESRDQMIVQITDLPVQVIAAENKAIVWVNDIKTGKPAANADVVDVSSGKKYTTDKNGVAVIERALKIKNDEQLKITSSDGRECIWIYKSASYWNRGFDNTPNESDKYWSYFQLDRSLFKCDDTVSFWGFIKNRKDNEKIDSVTVTLTQGYDYSIYDGYSYDSREVLLRQVVPVINNSYSSELNLPNLDTGTYNLTVFHGDKSISSTYFTIQDYVKPPYKLEVTADKKAVFSNEKVNFTIKAGFFEGTPVSNLDVTYGYSGYNLKNRIYDQQVKTNVDGEAKITVGEFQPYADNVYGETLLNFNADATLPEIGQVFASESVRVFVNDVELEAEATRDGKKAEISVNVNSITLDRINDGTAENRYDYIDKPVSGKTVSVEIYRTLWVKEKNGEYYDYVEKKNQTSYSYTYKEEKIDSFNIITDADGKASKNFTVPDKDKESYFARIACVDGKGRKTITKSYLGHDWTQYYLSLNENRYFLDGVKDSYSIGDEVNLKLKRGEDVVKSGSFLFVVMQNGILSYYSGKNLCSFNFGKEHIPNAEVNAYYYNGYNYVSTYQMKSFLSFDTSMNNLLLTAKTDKASYKPGEECTVTITAKGINGVPKKANVNISVVDEALFALADYNVDTLKRLYHSVGLGLNFVSPTHKTYEPAEKFTPKTNGGDLVEAETAEASYESSPMGRSFILSDSQYDEVYLREIFKDTAFFKTLTTNDKGEVKYTFKLPDNITSWRLTASGISNDLFAGSAVQNINVTNPMFINYTLNDTFLIGDTPAVGVSVYGSSLKGSEKVNFEVWDESAPDVKFTAEGTAFERVNIPLWTMKNEGSGSLIIKAVVSGGTGDSIKHQYQTLKTYRQSDAAKYYDVTKDTKFEVGTEGLTSITFTDKGRGQYLQQLFDLRYAYGDRIEKLTASREANRLIEKYFPEINLYGDGKSGFNPKDYQHKNGGMTILTYADSDVETTVKLLKYVKNEVNVNALVNYLYKIYESENSANKMCALYGLAQLKQPVLLDLDKYALLESISVKDAVYVALGYASLGEKEKADAIYKTKIAPKLEHTEPFYRANTGVDDSDDILEATSAANLLAAALNKPEREGLYQYCIKNYTEDVLINIEKLMYIESEIEKASAENASVTYALFGEKHTRELKNGSSYTLKIPVKNLGDFKLTDVSGAVSAVSVYKKPLSEITTADSDVAVYRRYYKGDGNEPSNNSFEQGDLVRVQIWIDYSKKAIDGSYCVTDYLPSGLEFVDDSAKVGSGTEFGRGYRRYAKADGQKITFYDYNNKFNKGYLYYYYARVISPGTFKAEGTLVQNLTAKGYISLGQDETVTIK